MNVLMFGWEFPPHILGGLVTASYGITKGLSLQPDTHITFCIPRPSGDEDKALETTWIHSFTMRFVTTFMPISVTG